MHREQIGKCLGCGSTFTRPVAPYMRDEIKLGMSAGFDVMGFCSGKCEEVKLNSLFWQLRTDPGMFLAHMFGLDKQTHQDRRRFEDSKRSKAAFA